MKKPQSQKTRNFGVKITFLLFILNVSEVSAQCSIPIPNSAIVVNSDTLLSGIQDTAWVCAGDSVNVSGIKNVYFLESGAKLNSGSCINNNIYAKSGSIITGGGINDTIYYELGATITYQGTGLVEILCSALIFDYTDAPLNGCSTASLDKVLADDFISIFPNPTSQVATLKLNQLSNKKIDVRIYTIDGQLIRQIESITENKVIIENLISGIYFIQVIQNNELIQIEKLSVID